MSAPFRVERRLDCPAWLNWAIPVGAVATALLAGAVLLFFLGVSPLAAYTAMFRGALGDAWGLSETIVKAIPLTLAGLAVGLSFTMVFVDSAPVMFFLMFVAAALAGGLWAGFAGFLKARWSVNEIITTLMMNYIAILLTEYFIYGPWRDPSSLGFPMTAPFPAAARLAVLGGTRVHVGLILAIFLALLFRVLYRWTRWGFELRVIGNNANAARYAGMDYMKNVLLAMFVSGAVAGIAGMIEVAGLQGRIQPGFSAGYGYTAIIVAWLARLNPVGTVFVSFLLGALLVGGDTLQVVMRLPLASVQVLQGLILFCVLGGEFFRNYRIVPVGKGE